MEAKYTEDLKERQAKGASKHFSKVENDLRAL